MEYIKQLNKWRDITTINVLYWKAWVCWIYQVTQIWFWLPDKLKTSPHCDSSLLQTSLLTSCVFTALRALAGFTPLIRNLCCRGSVKLISQLKIWVTEETQYLTRYAAKGLQLVFICIRPQRELLACFLQNGEIIEHPCSMAMYIYTNFYS